MEGSEDSTGEERVQFQDVTRLQAVSVSAEYLCGHHQVEEGGGSLAQRDANMNQVISLRHNTTANSQLTRTALLCSQENVSVSTL